MAKTTTGRSKKWTLYDGVGFDGQKEHKHSDYVPATHYVVLMQSLHSGTHVFGPFVSDDAAHKWVREESDGEVYQRYGRASAPGVSFTVDYLDIPLKRGE